MREIARTISTVPLPAPRVPIAIRTATMADLPFMDALQKKHNKALGYFPTKQFEGYIGMGAVLVAEATNKDEGGRMKDEDGKGSSLPSCSSFIPHPSSLPVGYVISRDRYLKRDELGVIYQLCVAPGDQRKLVGASLIKAVFERSAYGCRLYCCWCAQDLDANYFWESLGFMPIAFRAGSSGKRRVHIFWQKRIVEGDTVERMPWWYPFKTDSGAIREDRIVFPIPPGVHWQDVRAPSVRPPVVRGLEVGGGGLERRKALADGSRPTTHPRPTKILASVRQIVTRGSALRFAPPVVPVPSVPAAPAAPVKSEKGPREKKPAARIDPAYLKAARELRDRYLERVNETVHALVSCGKYDVSRTLSEVEGSRALAPARGPTPSLPLASHPLPQLPVAA